MNDSIISYWRDARGAFRGVTALVLTTFVWMQMYPVAAAAKDAIEGNGVGVETAIPASFTHGKANTPSSVDPQRVTMEALSKTLNGMHAALKKHRDLIVKRKDKKGNLHITITGTEADVDLTGARKEIIRIKQELALQDQQAEADFKRDDVHIKAHHLSAIIQQRHDDAVAKYEKNRDDFRKRLDAIMQSQDLDTLIAKTDTLLKSVSEDLPKKARLDPKNLSFRTVDGAVREPATTPEALRKILSLSKTPQTIPVLDVTQRKQEINEADVAAIQKARNSGGIYEIPTEPVSVATIGNMSGLFAMAAVTPPGPEYLLPTEDVQITPGIQALATQLHNNPIEIYNWVHDNIEFLPSYGSIQGSQLTLEKKKGNAFDTSSLLVALLRSSGIPSRYVYGTIDVPTTQINNWVGGTTISDATQQILGQGGIPNTGLTKGGQTFAIRMEHVWVEAFTDVYPSRAAKNISPEAWVPMDASFKQYTINAGADLQNAVPFNAQSFIADGNSGATIDEQQESVKNLNQSLLTSDLSQYGGAMDAYVNQQVLSSNPSALVGSKTINSRTPATLPSGLPYRVAAVSRAYAVLPSSLHHQFQYNIYLDRTSQMNDDPVLSFKQDTVTLSGKSVILEYVPASLADLQALESYMPQPNADGSPLQYSQLPQSLPGYSIYVTARLVVDNQVVATGGSFTLGQEVIGVGGFTAMNLTSWDLSTDILISGQQSAMGVSLEGISQAQLANLSTRLQNADSQMRVGNVSGLDGARVAGDILTSTIWTYFATIEGYGRAIQQKYGVIDSPGLSYGFFHADVAPITSYGVVTRMQFAGGLMDVGHNRRLAFSKGNDVQTWVEYNRIRGLHASAMEHVIPELFLSNQNLPIDDSNQPQAVSAVKALDIAQQQGQRIWRITNQNASTALPNITMVETVGDDVSSALAAGNEVMIHERPISASGFSGMGYIILDPATGSGSYLIQGGAHGGKIAKGLLTAVGFVLLFTGVAEVGAFVLTLLAIVSVMVAMYSVILNAILIQDEGGQCAQRASGLYLDIFFPLTIAAAIPGVSLLDKFVFRLIGIMYGGDLFKGFAASRACQ